MFDIKKYSEELFEKNGIYFSKKDSIISFPDEGYDLCFDIEDNSFWFHHRNSCIVAGVKRYCTDKIIFDMGGGTVLFLKPYKMQI